MDSTSIQNRWYVSCGCDSHGDHLGCDKSCHQWGCSFPLKVEVTAPTEALADEWSGGRAPKRAIADAIEHAKELAVQKHIRANRKHKKRMARLNRLTEEYSD